MTKIEYKNLLLQYNIEYPKCKICNDVIYYYSSDIKLKNGVLKYSGKTHINTKNINGDKYYLCVCEECLSKEFPDYNNKNKSKVFNTNTELSAYAYGIPSNIIKKFHKDKAITLENMIARYGEEKGKIKFKSYCDKQSETNTFEYKNKKYGMSKEEFDEYNKSRAVTLELCIKRHGEEKGKEVFKNYCNKQITNGCTKDYFIQKYGEEKGLSEYQRICSEKLLIIENFIRKYGEIDGAVRYEEYISKTHIGYSKISQELFWNIYEKLDNDYKKDCHFAELNKEYKIHKFNGGWYLYDFVIKDLKYCIEFNGDVFHANPELFCESDTPNPYNKTITAKDIWEVDKDKIQRLQNEGFVVKIVWESDYKKDKQFVLDTIINEINSLIQRQNTL